MSNQIETSGQPTKKNIPLRVLIIVIILAVGVGVAVFLKKTAPKAQKVAPVKQAQLVQVQPVKRGDSQAKIYSYGTVVAARSVVLKSQVSGQVVEMNPQFDLGACLAAGTTVVQIDPRDYRLAVEKQQAAVNNAQAGLNLEQGQQDVARQEWQMFRQQEEGASEPPPLALRAPYLLQAQAQIATAQSGLEQARLDLQRTTIRVPFDALVTTKEVELGAQLMAQGAVATLVATDTFWVEVSVPVAQLPWLELPRVNSETGARAQIGMVNSDASRQGQVVRLLGHLKEGGRMARLLVAIDDPLEKQQPLGQRRPLLLGDYVEVTLFGRSLADVVPLSRNVVHNGNQVWLLSAENTLIIRTVDILWKDRDTIYVRHGLEDGDLVIVSDLSVGVEGMALRIDQPVKSSNEAL